MKIKDEGHLYYLLVKWEGLSGEPWGIRSPDMALKYSVSERKSQAEDTEVFSMLHWITCGRSTYGQKQAGGIKEPAGEHRGFPSGSNGKKIPPAMRETWVGPLCREDPREKGFVTHSSTLAWRIPRTEKPGRLQSTGSQSWTWLSD